jgi:hypothetical protein
MGGNITLYFQRMSHKEHDPGGTLRRHDPEDPMPETDQPAKDKQ